MPKIKLKKLRMKVYHVFAACKVRYGEVEDVIRLVACSVIRCCCENALMVGKPSRSSSQVENKGVCEAERSLRNCLEERI